MLKKILIGSAATLGVAFLLVGGSVFDHVSSLFGSARESVQEALPVEYELQRAEDMVRKIGPEVEKAKRTVAEEQVAIDELEAEIARIERRAEGAEEKVKLQNAALKTGERTYVLGARSVGRAQLESEMRLAFDGLRDDRKLAEAKRRLLEARVASLSAAVRKLETVRSEETGLRTTIENLRARLRHTQAMEAVAGRMTLDDGALAKAKEILARCRKRIDVAAKMLENETGAVGSPASGPETRDVCAEVDRFFDEERRGAEASSVVVAPSAATDAAPISASVR
ncbi:MAG TPA: hypothetical protein VEI02_04025 [Planctomycetota bacterium]|nr:hypothetical protein [Planctomycetota bacterium]